jgi:hypothetical protein
MEDIRIIEKPNNISFDDIHNLLMEANKRNFKNGIVLRYAKMPAEEIIKTLGKEGRTWVAMDGDKLVGTTSVTFIKGKDWWNKGKKVAHGCFTGILKSYQGIGIMEELNAKKYAYILASGADMNQGDTAENNKIMRKVLEKDGYKTVEFFSSKSSHYSIKIVKWLSECPFTEKYINRRYKISEKLTRWQYKPGKIERSRIVSLFCKVAKKVVKIYYGD